MKFCPWTLQLFSVLLKDTAAEREGLPRWRSCDSSGAESYSAAESKCERWWSSGRPSDRRAPPPSEDSALLTQRQHELLNLLLHFIKTLLMRFHIISLYCLLYHLILAIVSFVSSCLIIWVAVLLTGAERCLTYLLWVQRHWPDLLVERAGVSDSSNTVRCCRLASLQEVKGQRSLHPFHISHHTQVNVSDVINF